MQIWLWFIWQTTALPAEWGKSTSIIEKKKDRNYGMAALFYRPLVRFFRAYIQKGGFRDGKEGFVCACYEGIYQFVAVSKIIEDRLKHKKGK